jgi:hypothetical protein
MGKHYAKHLKNRHMENIQIYLVDEPLTFFDLHEMALKDSENTT